MPRRELAIVLVRPYSTGNLGSAARAAKNFGVRDLRVVEPAAAADDESRRLASGADDLLERIQSFSSLESAVSDLDVVVATSSLRGREKQRFLALADLPRFLEEIGTRAKLGFVFGPERSGLTEQERARAAVSLRLPAEPEFPTLNVSHALAAVLAVTRAFDPQPVEEPVAVEWAPAADIEAALEHWDRALDAIGFYDTGHRDRSLRAWRRIVAARPLSRREVAILRGVANRVLVALRTASRKP